MQILCSVFLLKTKSYNNSGGGGGGKVGQLFKNPTQFIQPPQLQKQPTQFMQPGSPHASPMMMMPQLPRQHTMYGAFVLIFAQSVLEWMVFDPTPVASFETTMRMI
jgi:hypothetical protein